MDITDVLTIVITAIGIFTTTIIAIRTIRKSAIESRVSKIHTEMTSCIIETVFIINEVLTLLREIAGKVFYESIPEGNPIGNAYNRFWGTIDDYSSKLKEIQAKQRIVFPRELYKECQKLIKKLNEARNISRDLKPDKNNIYPDTSQLIPIVNDTISLYTDFLNIGRKYSGADKLKPIVIKEDVFLKDNIRSESSN